jgi:hypothetical protein
MSTISYLERFLEPMTEAFTAELAQKIVDLRADSETQAFVDELATKANEGTLTREEEVEYKEYIEAADIVGIIQSKARRFLAQQQAQHG